MLGRLFAVELHFDAEDFLKRDQKIYVQLSERASSQTKYMLDCMKSFPLSILLVLRLMVLLFTSANMGSEARSETVQRFLDKPDLEALLTRSKEIYDDYQEQAATMEKRTQKDQ